MCVHKDVYGAENTGQTGFEHGCPKERQDLSTPFALTRTGHTIRPNPKRVDMPSHYGQEGEELERKERSWRGNSFPDATLTPMAPRLSRIQNSVYEITERLTPTHASLSHPSSRRSWKKQAGSPDHCHPLANWSPIW